MSKRTWCLLAVGCLLASAALAAPSTSCATDAELARMEAELLDGLGHGPRTVGEEIRLTFASPAAGVAATGAGEPVWSQEIHDPGATYIAPHFESFNLPAGARAVVRSPDGSRSWEYTGSGKPGLAPGSGFWGLHIPGETAVVEVYSNVPLPAGAVVVGGYARGFEALPDPGTESLCGVDDSEWAKCYETSEPGIYNQSRAVARLLIGGTSACTGWLVGDEGHILTNEHCIGSSSAALNTDYELMAEGGTCSTNCASFGGCPGTVVATSGTLVRVNSTLDYSLVLLPTNPTATYGFFQMRSAGAVAGERIYIPGHPAAWGKRIAVASSHSADSGGFCQVNSLTESPCSGGGGSDVGYYCDTQGGSSGSPVVAYSDHTVVALHHCRGNLACTGTGGDPNRGVPIESVIADLGADLPNNSVSGEPPPPPPPCLDKGASCTADSECCSGKCRGKQGAKTCK